ncbi:DNA primase [Candidatus Parcubacteria bacterium]|nr:DNA primase [Candidatus Parcubacteria bacterium]
MRGDVDTIKERLDIGEVVGQYVKLEKAGKNLKGRCPFHNEKTASFFVSPDRQSFYCFGCGAKGDIFTFVGELEGLDFKATLKLLAERAGVELTYVRPEVKTEKDKIFAVLEDAALYFESNLRESAEAKKYLLSRGITDESMKTWRLGFVPEEWRLLYAHLTSLGYSKEILFKAGLIKQSEEHKDKEPYDIFRGRLIFPLFDPSGRVIALSGRALMKEAEPKYLNSPDTVLFNKSEILYGLDKAKDEVRKKNYAVLVEGQMDLVLSHQAGVKNTVASSGTAFTQAHLERLKRLSARIILAFDGDTAGKKAAEKSTILALSLGMEVKVAELPEGKDPADLVGESQDKWKDVLRESKHAIEIFLGEILKNEKDARKVGKAIERSILPLIALLSSAIERAHFVSLIAKRSGIREEVLWEDLKRIKTPHIQKAKDAESENEAQQAETSTARERIEERLAEALLWQKELPESSSERIALEKEVAELTDRLSLALLEEEIVGLKVAIAEGQVGDAAVRRIEELARKRDEERRKLM